MIFLTYDFIAFALIYQALYALGWRFPQYRIVVLIFAGFLFQFFYGGIQSLIVALTLAIITYVCASVETESRS